MRCEGVWNKWVLGYNGEGWLSCGWARAPMGGKWVVTVKCCRYPLKIPKDSHRCAHLKNGKFRFTWVPIDTRTQTAAAKIFWEGGGEIFWEGGGSFCKKFEHIKLFWTEVVITVRSTVGCSTFWRIGKISNNTRQILNSRQYLQHFLFVGRQNLSAVSRHLGGLIHHRKIGKFH